MARFTKKVALVTGAAQGIGRGVALALAAEGARAVIVNDVATQTAKAEATAAEARQMGAEALVWSADVSDRTAVAEMVGGVIARFGQLDIVVANAAITVRSPVIDLAWEEARRVIEVSQFGVFHTCQLSAQQMVQQPLNGRSRGKIVIIGSVHEQLAVPDSAPYNMAKTAVNHLARTLAVELAPYRINVNVVNPGWIDTPGERRHSSEETIAQAGRRIPWGRLGVPDDIAQAAVFLASDAADYVTGASLRVDGGFVLGLRLPQATEI